MTPDLGDGGKETIYTISGGGEEIQESEEKQQGTHQEQEEAGSVNKTDKDRGGSFFSKS